VRIELTKLQTQTNVSAGIVMPRVYDALASLFHTVQCAYETLVFLRRQRPDQFSIVSIVLEKSTNNKPNLFIQCEFKGSVVFSVLLFIKYGN